jgi:flagellar protein FlbD
MVKVERFDKSTFYVNPHQIEFIESTPDTVITLLSGRKIVVRNPARELIDEIVEYRKKIGRSFGGNED